MEGLFRQEDAGEGVEEPAAGPQQNSKMKGRDRQAGVSSKNEMGRQFFENMKKHIAAEKQRRQNEIKELSAEVSECKEEL